MSKPRIVILAGPKGAGKSTVAKYLLTEKFLIDEFVNADSIAAGLSAFAPEAWHSKRAESCFVASIHC